MNRATMERQIKSEVAAAREEMERDYRSSIETLAKTVTALIAERDELKAALVACKQEREGKEKPAGSEPAG